MESVVKRGLLLGLVVSTSLLAVNVALIFVLPIGAFKLEFLGLAATISVGFFWAGFRSLPVGTVGLLHVFNVRNERPESELTEGFWWSVPFVTSVRTYSILENTQTINASIPTGSDLKVDVEMVVNWRVIKGALFHVSQFKDVGVVIENQVRGDLATLLGLIQDTDDLSRANLTARISTFVAETLRLRAEGKVYKLSDGDWVNSGVIEGGDGGERWGIRIERVNVLALTTLDPIRNQRLTQKIDGIRADSARNISSAAELLMDAFATRGVSPNVAAGIVQQVLLPDARIIAIPSPITIQTTEDAQKVVARVLAAQDGERIRRNNPPDSQALEASREVGESG